ncbi:AMP-binding protein [Gammaproteobacteria bacterium]|nr:AMP-binding protein [Gammaproteobacteria bacterium]
MYAEKYVQQCPDRAAFIMASTGVSVSYKEFEARSNRLAHYLQSQGLVAGDHYSMFMENNEYYLEICGAGERSGLFYTCINSYLTPSEAAYIINNSESKVLFVSPAKLEVAVEALAECPNIEIVLVVDSDSSSLPEGMVSYSQAIEALPSIPIDKQLLGHSMLYSSGTTGRPKGIIRPLSGQAPDSVLPVFQFLEGILGYRDDMVYLSPAPLYHSAPQAAINLAIRRGATVVIMERFDPVEYLRLVEHYQVSHSQLVPTMFSRMLKLSDEERQQYDLSSMEFAVHAAAPCPEIIKRQMIDWWGPIIHEYYGATEGLGFAVCDSHEWLAHPGTVGKVVAGELSVLDDEMNPSPKGEPGTLWFANGSEFRYFNDPEKTAEATSPSGEMTTVGDVGYVDEDGFLFLTDRKAFMIISGGVNIYPQESEDLLISHPKVADAAVFGVPNADFGEEVKAVIQPIDGITGDQSLTEELLQYLGKHLSRQKVPRSIDYQLELPRLPTGKLYKRALRDSYWDEG